MAHPDPHLPPPPDEIPINHATLTNLVGPALVKIGDALKGLTPQEIARLLAATAILTDSAELLFNILDK